MRCWRVILRLRQFVSDYKVVDGMFPSPFKEIDLSLAGSIDFALSGDEAWTMWFGSFFLHTFSLLYFF